MTPRPDSVVVVGGGPAGCAAALVLAWAGVRVTLLAWNAASRSGVIESLPPQAAPVLRRIGVWEAFLSAGFKRSPGNLSLWGDSVPRATDFIFSPHGSGWHVERGIFDALLRTEAIRAGAAMLTGRAVREHREGSLWHVLFESSPGSFAEITATGLIWAAGRRAPLPSVLGTTRHRLDSLVGATAFVEMDSAPTDARTWIEAVPHGWWYSAPASANRFLIAFMTDADLLPNRNDERSVFLAQNLATTRLMRQRVAAPPFAWRVGDSRTSSLSPVSGVGWLAVGDAVFSMDPLSSQGITFALESGARAALEITGAAGATTFIEWLAGFRAQYHRSYEHYYLQETRWPESEFWRRRHIPSPAVSTDGGVFARSSQPTRVVL